MEEEKTVCPDCEREGCICTPGECECTPEENCGCEEQTSFDETDDFFSACEEDENIDIVEVE